MVKRVRSYKKKMVLHRVALDNHFVVNHYLIELQRVFLSMPSIFHLFSTCTYNSTLFAWCGKNTKSSEDVQLERTISLRERTSAAFCMCA